MPALVPTDGPASPLTTTVQALKAVPIPLLLIGSYVLYRIGLTIYRLYFHPLAKVPGPKLWAATGVPYYYYDKFAGTFFREANALYEQYGPIVRVGPNQVILESRVSAKEILARGPPRPEFGKYPIVYGVKEPVGIAAAPKENHRMQRRVIGHAFSEKALQEQEIVFRAYIDKFIARIGGFAKEGKPCEMTSWFNFMTFDVIGDMAFGETFGSLESGQWHPWVELIVKSTQFFSIMQIIAEYPLTAPLMFASPRIRKLAAKAKDSSKMSVAQTNKRIAMGSEGRQDFMSYILRANADGKGMTTEDLHQNTFLLLVGGSETTATALTGLFWLLTRERNRKAKQTLIDEIRSAGFNSPEEITMVSTNPLKYLFACVEEALRMHPPAIMTPPRVSPGDIVSKDLPVYLPKGTKVDTNNYAAGCSPQYWTEPEVFAPARWLPKTHPLYVPGKYEWEDKAAFKPFSAGPRDCVGKNLSYAEMRLVVTMLIWNFDFESGADQEDWQDVQWGHNGVWSKADMWIQFTPRKFA